MTDLVLSSGAGDAAAIGVDCVGYRRDQHVVLATSDTIAAQERELGRLVAGPSFVEALADIRQVFPGARVIDARLPRSPRPSRGNAEQESST